MTQNKIFYVTLYSSKENKRNNYHQGGKIMCKVSRELVVKTGIDVNELLELLII